MSDDPPSDPPALPVPVIAVIEQQRAAARRAIEAHEQFEFITGQASFGIDDDDALCSRCLASNPTT
jgi:hypothetical protein